MDIVRLSKIAFVAVIGLFATMTVWGDIAAYPSKFFLAQQAVFMEAMFPDAGIGSRVTEISIWNHAFYIFIVVVQLIAAALCWFGAFKMYRRIRGSKQDFNESKKWAIGGLALGVVVWQIGLIAGAGEWFGMRVSKSWSEMDLAFRFCMIAIGVIIFVCMPDEERDPW